MPHIKISMFPGRTDEMKQELADAIVRDVSRVLGSNEESISVSIEDIPQNEWDEKIYSKIVDEKDNLFKKPGYGSLSE